MPADLTARWVVRRAVAVAAFAMSFTLAACTTGGPGPETRAVSPATTSNSSARVSSASHAAPSIARSSARPPRRVTSAPPRPAADPHRAGLVGNGVFVPVPLAFPAIGPGRTVRYAVEIEQGIPIDRRDFAIQVHATLTHPRGWQGVDHVALQEVSSAADATIIVTLATPRTTDQLCAPLDTGGWLDCWSRGRAVINSDRWFVGSPTYGSDLADYRHELVNHEVGHGLGHGHRFCPGAGQPAPVMQQQTISLQGCKPNPWPSVTGG